MVGYKVFRVETDSGKTTSITPDYHMIEYPSLEAGTTYQRLDSATYGPYAVFWLESYAEGWVSTFLRGSPEQPEYYVIKKIDYTQSLQKALYYENKITRNHLPKGTDFADTFTILD